MLFQNFLNTWWDHEIADSAQPRYRSIVTRPFSLSCLDVVFSDDTLSPNALMLTLRDFQPTTDYQFLISSVNTAGTGEQACTQFRTITEGV